MHRNPAFSGGDRHPPLPLQCRPMTEVIHGGQRPPSRWLFASLAYTLLAAALAIGVSLQMPWLGLRLAADVEQGRVFVADASGPSATVPRDAVLQALSAPADSGLRLTLEAGDLIEEPDLLPGYAQMDAFFARQSRLAMLLQQPEVVLHWEHAGRSGAATVQPQPRPLSALPLLFWFQVAVSVSGCLIACWVWVLRPGDAGARMFGVTGLLFPVFVMPAAIYSGRELALPGDLFSTLSALNHGGSSLFGAALGAIFLAHPQPLVRPVHMVWPFLVFGGWSLIDTLRIASSPDWGFRFPIMLELLLAVSLAVLQWRRSRGDALGRASLRWLSLSLLIGSGLFILLIITTASLGWLPPMPQGYAFGFFLFIYIGIALGLRRYRLFELDEWAFRMLLWIGGALAVVAVDALLILALDWSAGPALGLSLWICGALYFPARQWLWQRLAHRPSAALHEVMPDVVHIAFQSWRQAREGSWDSLLRRLFSPLHLEDLSEAGAQVQLDDSGLALDIPACGGVSARRLRYAAGGQRLFSTKDAAFMRGLCQLMDAAENSREAHERGAADERKRIARDMHDDVGARLLMLIHRARTPEVAELARSAMNDLRTALATLDAQPIAVADAVADWRAEAMERCEASGTVLSWQMPPMAEVGGVLASRQRSVVERALREGLTNALKHARPRRIDVELRAQPGWLDLSIANDGSGTAPQAWREGRGLRGMRQRLAECGAVLRTERLADGRVQLALSMRLTAGEGGR